MSDTHVLAVVVDDEPSAREAVLTLLQDHPNVHVVGEASNGREAVQLIMRERPDLLFMDIQMPDLDGFGVLGELGELVPRAIIFVTAHDEHAMRAFDVHALDYVLKPFGKPRFLAAVARAVAGLKALDALSMRRTLESIADDRRVDMRDAGDAIVSAPESGSELTARPTGPRRIGVRTGSRITILAVDAIDWVEASGDYARIHVGKTVHVVAQRMHALERLLEARQFVRIHRSLIVNVDRIHELHREGDGSGTLILQAGVRLRVARGRWTQLESALDMEEY